MEFGCTTFKLSYGIGGTMRELQRSSCIVDAVHGVSEWHLPRSLCKPDILFQLLWRIRNKRAERTNDQPPPAPIPFLERWLEEKARPKRGPKRKPQISLETSSVMRQLPKVGLLVCASRLHTDAHAKPSAGSLGKAIIQHMLVYFHSPAVCDFESHILTFCINQKATTLDRSLDQTILVSGRYLVLETQYFWIHRFQGQYFWIQYQIEFFHQILPFNLPDLHDSRIEAQSKSKATKVSHDSEN